MTEPGDCGHVGGWTHISVWVEKAEARDLVDTVTSAVFAWGKARGIDPYVGGALNANPPDFAVHDGGSAIPPQ